MVKDEDFKSLPLRPGVKEALHYYKNGSLFWQKNQSISSKIDFHFAPTQPTQRSLIQKVGFKIIGKFIASWHPVLHYQMELQMKDILSEKIKQ